MKQTSFRRLAFWVFFAYLFQIFSPFLIYAQNSGLFLQGRGQFPASATPYSNPTPGFNLDGPGSSENSTKETSVTAALSKSGLTYQVHILGEVERPGTYRLPASTRVFEAIQLAGGIQKNGSDRFIELRRAAKKTPIDMVAYRMMGRLDQNPYLMDNDVVFVPLRKRVIEIEGAVNRPGNYELRAEKTLADVVGLAGNFSQGVSKMDPIRIVRFESDEQKQVIPVTNTPENLKQTPIRDGDVVFIPHLFTKAYQFDYNLKQLPKDNIYYPSYENRVFIVGAITLPGAYNFAHHYKLPQYLAAAGGTTRMAKNFVKVISPEGKIRKLKLDSQVLINPGDTIYIPERLFSRETWASLLVQFATLGVAATGTIKSLTD